ncbi:hypothetical protein QMA0440_02867 [Yersinia ruckeri]|nr:hypothetical protein [Yersinia ruckeri]ARZ02176.1 hypothetical protein QMA0440_02867 [Yersinia ruckeri]KFE37670.1 integrase [Yersinia ruckeri]
MMNAKAKRDIALKTKALNYANNAKNVAKTCDILVLAGKPITHGKKPMSAMENKG